MPSRDIHYDQAIHNSELAKELINQEPLIYKDWALIIAFYAALHLVEAVMADDNVHSDKEKSPHSFRRNWVKNSSLSQRAQKAYLKLYNLSLSLRYLANSECKGKNKGNWITDVEAKKILNDNLQFLRQEISELLAS